LGAAALGNLYAAMSDGDAAATLEAAGADAWVDTAPYYGHGLSERRIGGFLRAGLGRRLRLSTKVGRRLEPDPAPPDHGFASPDPFRPVFDYSFDGALRSFDASLARLGVTRVETLLLHDVGRQVHGVRHAEVMAQAERGAWAAMRRLKAEGAVERVGVGVNEVEVCFEALERFGPDVILLAGRHTLLDRSAERAGLLDACAAGGVTYLAAAPFNSGLLAGGAHFDYAPAEAATAARARRLAEACRARGVDLTAAALQFPLRNPAVAAVLAGARSAAELHTQTSALGTAIPDDLWAELEAAAA
jgi:D-threo-aldose 1-dehydrogenase